MVDEKPLLVTPTMAEQKLLARMRQEPDAMFVVFRLKEKLVWTMMPKLEMAKE